MLRLDAFEAVPVPVPVLVTMLSGRSGIGTVIGTVEDSDTDASSEVVWGSIASVLAEREVVAVSAPLPSSPMVIVVAGGTP